MADLPDTEGKNLVEMLDMLKPIPEPHPISMVPATPGWIWLGLALLALVLWLAFRARQRWQANAYRRAALAQLDAAGDDPLAIATILRRTALAAFPRGEVASLTGPDWLDFLDRTGKGGFVSEAGEVLIRAPYRSEPANPEAARLARSWIRTHKPEGAK